MIQPRLHSDLAPRLGVFLLLLSASLVTSCLPEAEPAWDPDTTQAGISQDSPGTVASSPSGKASTTSNRQILQAYENGRSDVWVRGGGRVVRLLADDLQGSRHQRFIVSVAPSHTVLISHNIDLAPKIPLGEGDIVEFRGEYEWNDRGGVVHWTHHDPRGRREGGWVELGGRRFE